MLALEGPDVEMAVKVSFSVRNLTETLPTVVIWTVSQPFYWLLKMNFESLIFTYDIRTDILVWLLSQF